MARVTKIELQQQVNRLTAENAELRAQLSQLRNDAAMRSAPSTKREQIEFMRALAKALNTTTRLTPHGEIEYYVRGRGWTKHSA